MGRAWDRRAQEAVGALTQSARVREGFLGERTSEMYRTSKDQPGKEGRNMCTGYEEEIERHTPENKSFRVEDASLIQWFSCREHLAMFEDIVGCHKWGEVRVLLIPSV